MINAELTSFILGSDIHFYDETQPFDKIMREKFHVCGNEFPQHSFFLNDIGELVNNVDQLKNCIPNANLYYKVSANPDRTLVCTLYNYGVNFSVSSGPEIETLISFGVSPHSIIYSGVCKLNSHIRCSAQHGIRILSFGTLSELKNIAKHYPSCDLLLRLQPYSPVHPERTLLKASASNVDSVIQLVKQAKEYGMNVVGLELALDCEVEIPESLYRKLFVLLMRSYSILVAAEFNPSYVYFNGGIPSPTKNSVSKSRFDIAVNMITQFNECYPRVRIMVEPTDFIIDSAAQLCCSVIGLNPSVHPTDQFGNVFYYLNDGLYGSLGCFLFRRYAESPDVIKRDPMDDELSDFKEATNATLWGPTCDSFDKVCLFQSSSLLNVGDLLRFKKLGSFAVSGATTFNGFSLANTYHMISYQKLENLGISRDDAERIFSERHPFFVETESR